MTTYRPEVAWPRELAQAARHFASGVNDVGEARGLAMSGRHFGITLSDMRRGLLAELETHTHGLAEIFVDTGAFSEVAFPKDGPPVVVKPINHETWMERFDVALRIARVFRGRAMVVAPDRVGCQATTLERLARYAPNVAVIASTGARIIVPVQKGALPMSAFYAQACAILGLREAPIAGVPMKKDATSLDDLRELVSSLPWFGARIHLLGLGPKAKNGRYAKAMAIINAIRPNAIVTSDSTQAVRGEVGRTNGRGGSARRLTVAQDRARADGLRGSDVKENALIAVGLEDIDAELETAIRAGWFDVELYDSAEEALEDLLRRREEKAAGPFTAELAEAA